MIYIAVIWACIMSMFQRIVDTGVQGLMYMPDNVFCKIRYHHCTPIFATVDGQVCTGRINLLMWLYWNQDIPGVSVNHLKFLNGVVVHMKMSNAKIYNINIDQNKCNGKNIMFKEVKLD
jgi:hypothetical protein